MKRDRQIDIEFHLDPEVLGDIDAWNLRRSGDWYYFDANLAQADGPRGYRREVSGGDIIADTPGPVLGFLALGGSRVARGIPGVGSFPHHVVAPGDEVGAVGLAGLEVAEASAKAERLAEQPQIAATAHAFLGLKKQNLQGLPLIVARAEHDESSSVADLRKGPAFGNLKTAANSVANISRWLGKRTSDLIVSLDFVLEDVSGQADRWAEDMLALMRDVEREAWRIGFQKTHFISVMEHLAPEYIAAQSRLGFVSNDISFAWAAPGYAFERDRYCRTTRSGMERRAETEAIVIHERLSGKPWTCPTLLLAEWDPDRSAIRVTIDAAEPVVLDRKDPFSAGPGYGFTVDGVQISSVKLDRKDDRSVLLSVSKMPAPGAELNYAVNGPGALRDQWTHPSGARRWALPARLKIGQIPGSASRRKTSEP